MSLKSQYKLKSKFLYTTSAHRFLLFGLLVLYAFHLKGLLFNQQRREKYRHERICKIDGGERGVLSNETTTHIIDTPSQLISIFTDIKMYLFFFFSDEKFGPFLQNIDLWVHAKTASIASLRRFWRVSTIYVKTKLYTKGLSQFYYIKAGCKWGSVRRTC